MSKQNEFQECAAAWLVAQQLASMDQCALRLTAGAIGLTAPAVACTDCTSRLQGSNVHHGCTLACTGSQNCLEHCRAGLIALQDIFGGRLSLSHCRGSSGKLTEQLQIEQQQVNSESDHFQHSMRQVIATCAALALTKS